MVKIRNVSFRPKENFHVFTAEDERQQAYTFAASGAQILSTEYSESFNIYPAVTILLRLDCPRIGTHPTGQDPITAPTAVVFVSNPSHRSSDDELQYLRNKDLKLEFVNVCSIKRVCLSRIRTFIQYLSSLVSGLRLRYNPCFSSFATSSKVRTVSASGFSTLKTRYPSLNHRQLHIFFINTSTSTLPHFSSGSIQARVSVQRFIAFSFTQQRAMKTSPLCHGAFLLQPSPFTRNGSENGDATDTLYLTSVNDDAGVDDSSKWQGLDKDKVSHARFLFPRLTQSRSGWPWPLTTTPPL